MKNKDKSQNKITLYIRTEEDKVQPGDFKLLNMISTKLFQENAAGASGKISVILDKPVRKEILNVLSRFHVASVIAPAGILSEYYDTELYSGYLYGALEKAGSRNLIAAADYMNNDLCSRIAVDMKCHPLTDCYDVFFCQPDRRIFADRISNKGNTSKTFGFSMEESFVITVKGSDGMVFLSETRSIPEVTELAISDLPVSNLQLIKKSGFRKKNHDIQMADILVGCGLGVVRAGAFELAKELADSLHGEICVTRPVVDLGLADKEIQVGLSGKTVSPKIYIALGISGASQHVIGMKDSDYVIAVDSDRNAPIFDMADFGIVADVKELLTNLTALNLKM